MKKKILLSVLGSLCAFANAFSQTNNTGKTLAIGDRLPDVTISRISNYRTTTVKFSELQAPLIILDFWATWCGSCIKEFPHVEVLAKEFKGQVQFLLVNSRPLTKDDEAKINYFFSYKSGLKQVPVVAEDSTLCRYFVIPSLPRYVWLKADGTVLAITDQSEVTAVRIRAMLNSNTQNESTHPPLKAP